tara:strand:+ start:808 stop:981 length:174 start_codon:yes stop_codon:yes gene_type:complete
MPIKEQPIATIAKKEIQEEFGNSIDCVEVDIKDYFHSHDQFIADEDDVDDVLNMYGY